MNNLKNLAILAFGLGISIQVAAAWIEMTLVANDSFKSQGFGNSGWVTCTYSTGGWGSGNTVTINVTDYSCPYSIQYNPETNSWRK